jgi:predicted transposase/invertase (TIGR01784 family)
VYGLGLLNSVFDHDSDAWSHHYRMVNIEKPERRLEGLELIFVELPKFRPSTRTDKRLQVLWLRFMRELNDRTHQASEELLEVPEIKEAIALAEESAFTDAELEYYLKFWDAVSIDKTLWSGRYNEGLAAGKAEGIAEGAAKIITQMLAAGMTPSDVARIVGWSVDAVRDLQVR